MSDALSLLDLSHDDIAKLPAALRKKISAAFGPADQPSGDWLVVGAENASLARLVERAVRTLPPVMAARRAELSEQNIEKILDVILADLPRAAVDAELEVDNAELRAGYLQETKTLTAAAVRAASGLKPRNKSEPASRWKREGRIFAVRRAGNDLYPAFQFADGQPRPVIRKLLAVLPRDMTPWQVAFWFASGNGWLDGAAPQDRLDAETDVLAAASHLAAPAIG